LTFKLKWQNWSNLVKQIVKILGLENKEKEKLSQVWVKTKNWGSCRRWGKVVD
jgi:hypothetical protein